MGNPNDFKRVPFTLTETEALRILREKRWQEVRRLGLGSVITAQFRGRAAGGATQDAAAIRRSPNWEAEFNRDMKNLASQERQVRALDELKSNRSARKFLDEGRQAAYEEATQYEKTQNESYGRLGQTMPGPTAGSLVQRTEPGLSTPAPSVEQWKPMALGIAQRYGVPLDVVLGIMDIESSGIPDRDSPMNYDKNGNPIGKARGLMQIMPFHFDNAGIPENMWNDPATNIGFGTMLLAQAYKQYGNWDQAMLAYFTGTGDVEALNSKDATGTTGKQYIQKAQAARGKYGGGAATGQAPAATGPAPSGPKTRQEVLAEISTLLASGKPLLDKNGDPTELAQRIDALQKQASLFPQDTGKAGIDEDKYKNAVAQYNTYQQGRMNKGTPPQTAMGIEAYGEGAPPRSAQNAPSVSGGLDPYTAPIASLLAEYNRLAQEPDEIFNPHTNQNEPTDAGRAAKALADIIKFRQGQASEDRAAAAQEQATGLANKRFDWEQTTDERDYNANREDERRRILEMQTQLRMQGQAAIAGAKRDAMNRAGEMIRIPAQGFKLPAGASGFTPALDFGQYATPFDYSGPVKEEEAKMAEILAQ